jgi:hypothetical protein
MGCPGDIPKKVNIRFVQLLLYIQQEWINMKNMERDKKKLMKIRERKIKKLMKETKWGREEAEKWVNYTESFDKKKIEEMMNS